MSKGIVRRRQRILAQVLESMLPGTEEIEEITQLVKHLLCKCEGLSLTPRIHRKPVVLACVYNPSITIEKYKSTAGKFLDVHRQINKRQDIVLFTFLPFIILSLFPSFLLSFLLPSFPPCFLCFEIEFLCRLCLNIKYFKYYE